MVHGHEKSDFAIVAVKPTNKALHSARSNPQPSYSLRSRWSQGRRPRGMRLAKHVPGAEPGKRVTGAGPHTEIAKEMNELAPGSRPAIAPDSDEKQPGAGGIYERADHAQLVPRPCQGQGRNQQLVSRRGV